MSKTQVKSVSEVWRGGGRDVEEEKLSLELQNSKLKNKVKESTLVFVQPFNSDSYKQLHDDDTNKKRIPFNDEQQVSGDPHLYDPFAAPSHWPFFTIISLVVFSGVFAYTVYFNKGFQPITNNIFYGPSNSTLIAFGAKHGPLIFDSKQYAR
jgi:hypothetical protein